MSFIKRIRPDWKKTYCQNCPAKNPFKTEAVVKGVWFSRDIGHSCNTQYSVKVLQDELAAPVEIELIELNDYEMPIYNPEREAQGIPQQAQDFYDKIGLSDGLIMSFTFSARVTVSFSIP